MTLVSLRRPRSSLPSRISEKTCPQRRRLPLESIFQGAVPTGLPKACGGEELKELGASSANDAVNLNRTSLDAAEGDGLRRQWLNMAVDELLDPDRGLFWVAQDIPGRKDLPPESLFWQLGRGPFGTVCTTGTDPWFRTAPRGASTRRGAMGAGRGSGINDSPQ